MKIISKFKDYYDGVCQSIGIDEHIVYIRDNKESEEYLSYYLPCTEKKTYDKNNSKISTYYKFCIVGVAGKLYPLVIKKVEKFNIPVTTEYIYDIVQIKAIHDELWNPSARWVRRYNNWNDYIDLLNDNSLLNYFHEYKVGSFMINKVNQYSNVFSKPVYNLELEPVLKDIEFARVVDPYTLFIEMSMFISEQLNTEIDEHITTDKEKIVSKVFDYKYSFRKEKNK